jgi:uncharacterized integral membrane protein
MQRSYLITIFLLILALIFTFQNTGTINPRFLFWNFSGSLALITVIIFFIGFASGWLLGLSSAWKKNREIRELKKQLAEGSKPTSPGAIH